MGKWSVGEGRLVELSRLQALWPLFMSSVQSFLLSSCWLHQRNHIWSYCSIKNCIILLMWNRSVIPLCFVCLTLKPFIALINLITGKIREHKMISNWVSIQPPKHQYLLPLRCPRVFHLTSPACPEEYECSAGLGSFLRITLWVSQAISNGTEWKAAKSNP